MDVTFVRPETAALLHDNVTSDWRFDAANYSLLSPTDGHELTTPEFPSPAAAFDFWMRTAGFIAIRRKGSRRVTAQAREAAREFFAMPLELKANFIVAEQYGAGGYTPMGVETVSGGSITKKKEMEGEALVTDLVESLYFPSSAFGHELLRPLAQKFVPFTNEAMLVHREVTLLAAVALGFPNDPLLLYQHYIPPFEACHFKVAHYPANNFPKDALRYGSHTDWLGFTILSPDSNVLGLQYLDQATNMWRDVMVPDADTFMVNATDLIEIQSGGRWVAPLHRVSNAAADRSRISLVMFTGPSLSTPIKPVRVPADDEVTEIDKPAAYAFETVQDLLTFKLSKNSKKIGEKFEAGTSEKAESS